MDQATTTELLHTLTGTLDETALRREDARVWDLSGVERVYLSPNRTMIFKYAREPFLDEARVLTHVADHGLPVPRLLAATEMHGVLGMLLEDLGAPAREATVDEAATAAVAVHRLPLPPQRLPVLDSAALAELPSHAREHLTLLHAAGRWADTDDIDTYLQRLATVAELRARDAELPPYGLVHSEFHTTSLHVNADGRWRLLDFARAFVGPGLLDLVSWQGTTQQPDKAALRNLLHAYVDAGGARSVLADRAGLDAVEWALGWHRLWICQWYMEQAWRWMPDPRYDDHTANVVRRHLTEARQCLRA